jgi:gas vesicle protein
MRNKQLKELADDPNFISGIYNYCDRWCERCGFTARCRLYATEQADPDANDPELRDITNEKFWQKLRDIFRDTAEMITEWAAEEGIDLDSIDVTEEMAAHDRAIAKASQDQMSEAATEYAEAVQHWLRDEFSAQPDVHSDMPEPDTTDADITTDDAVEVIRWYQFFIAVKLIRALSGAGEANEEDFDEEDLLSFDMLSEDDDEDNFNYEEIVARSSLIDANGSAKTALIAIDRSLAAWRALQISLPDKSETIKPMLIELDRLRRSVETRFRHARDFIRPGFDESSSEFVS